VRCRAPHPTKMSGQRLKHPLEEEARTSVPSPTSQACRLARAHLQSTLEEGARFGELSPTSQASEARRVPDIIAPMRCQGHEEASSSVRAAPLMRPMPHAAERKVDSESHPLQEQKAEQAELRNKKIQSLLNLELCAGSAGYSARLFKHGLCTMPIDSSNNRHKQQLPCITLEKNATSGSFKKERGRRGGGRHYE
jgi:hypothetical protein